MFKIRACTLVCCDYLVTRGDKLESLVEGETCGWAFRDEDVSGTGQLTCGQL